MAQVSEMHILMSLSLERCTKFKFDTGADVTVISEEDYKDVGRLKLCESTKNIAAHKPGSFETLRQIVWQIVARRRHVGGGHICPWKSQEVITR